MKVCIVVPCFNEESRLCKESFISFANSHQEINFLFVNDGSTDNTTSVLNDMSKKSPKCSYMVLPKNSGKAEAVRQGMLNAYSSGFNHIGYLDADLTIPLSTAKEMLSVLGSTNAEFVFASRSKRFKPKENQNIPRQTLGFIFSQVSKTVLQLPVHDTQCGAKFFKSPIVPTLFYEKFLSRWIFDVEIFFRLKAYHQKSVKNYYHEFLLHHWEDNATSKVKAFDYLKVPYQIIKIFFKYRFTNKLYKAKIPARIQRYEDSLEKAS